MWLTRSFTVFILFFIKKEIFAYDPTTTPVSAAAAPGTPGKSAFPRHDSDPNLVQYLQPNDADSGKYDKLTTEDAEKQGLCTRPCDGAHRMICYYHFTLEHYTTVGPACGDCLKGNVSDCEKKGCVTADGFERPILTINRRLPSPSIQVCRGDTIIVDVKNRMGDRSTTIHWHGVYQRYTPYMDGVPMVTQCPILPENTFRYKFPALPYGTFFYHSHIGYQKMDGLEGSLIIRRPKSVDPNKPHFDFDYPSHTIVLTDWLHGMTDNKFPGNLYNNTGTRTESFLINGRSSFTGANGQPSGAPYSRFKVAKDGRYRFRLIGGSCLACPMLFIIEKHQMELIATDGTPVEPQTFDTITVFPGDRMDIVVHTNQSGGNYWIQLKTLCKPNVSAEAILEYVDTPSSTPSTKPTFDAFPRGRSLNALDESDCSEKNPNVCWNHINSLTTVSEPMVLEPNVTHRWVLAVDEYHFTVDNLFWNDDDKYHKFFQSSPLVIKTHLVENISNVVPPFPLLSQDLPIPEEVTCPKDKSVCVNSPGAKGQLCECLHVIEVKLNDVAEIIFVDWLKPNDSLRFQHPMHLHGTDIYVIEQGLIPPADDRRAFVDNLQARLVREADLKVTRPKPCIKDTVTIPPNGYVVVRVVFNNPGIWLMHCHFLFHAETGMGTVFKVGQRSEFVAVPPNFPQCNDYLPPFDPKEFDTIDFEDEPTKQS